MSVPFSPLLRWLGIGLAALSLVAFTLVTPGSLLRKADYVSAAVCHRRLSHSFIVAERQLPLCQRCTGTFPGALAGVLVHWLVWRRRRSTSFPRWWFFVPLLAFAALWALDGINSTTTDPQMHALMERWVDRPAGVGVLGYAPQPWLRLLSGTLMGTSMSVVLVPAFNQAAWGDGKAKASLRSWHELAFLIAVELAMAGMIYLLESSPSIVALYGISIYSSLGVITMFTLLGAMIFILASRHDASLVGWREAFVPLVWGLVFAFFMVATMDFTRLWLTGTIDGVPGLASIFVKT